MRRLILCAVLLLTACAPDPQQPAPKAPANPEGLTDNQINLRQRVASSEIVCINGVQYMDVGVNNWALVPINDRNGQLLCEGGITKGLPVVNNRGQKPPEVAPQRSQ